MTKRIHFTLGMVTGAILLWLFINSTLKECADAQPGADDGNVIMFKAS